MNTCCQLFDSRGLIAGWFKATGELKGLCHSFTLPRMIAYLEGEVLLLEEKAVILKTGGVGYRVAVLPIVLKKTKVGEYLALYVYHHIVQDDESLYGFDSPPYLQYFKLLLTVPSVGPRTALNILELASPKVLSQAVADSDVAILTKVSGVGKKTAQRIMVELKGKLKAPSHKQLSGSLQKDILEALQSLGYTSSQARQATADLPLTITSVEEAVRIILQQRGGRK